MRQLLGTSTSTLALLLGALALATACGEESAPGADTTAACTDCDTGGGGNGSEVVGSGGNGSDSAGTDGASAADTAAADAARTEPPTWHRDVAPIVMNRCANCHRDGGIAPFALDSAEAWADWGNAALGSIKAGSMPPWPPAEGCGEFSHSLRMPPSEVDTLEQWITAKRPLGDAAGATPLPEQPKLTPTHTLPMPEAYTPDAGKIDDYRCFLLDLDTSEELFVRGTQVLPGTDKQVHHVLIYALEGDMVATAEAADKKEAGPGYTCFGGPLPSQKGGILGFSAGFPNQIAAWVPGLSPRLLPKEVALRIGKGSRVVMQVHYNLTGGKPEADITTLQLVADTTPPERVLATRPLIIESLNIPAGEKEAIHKRMYRYYGKGEVRIHSMTPHMHLLGKRFEARVSRKDGSEECALSIPDWDFGWQMGYGRPVDKPLVLKDGDGMEISCVYDNSPGNQPLVDGKPKTPTNVSWGDGSFDEMCMLYLDMSEPYAPAPPEGSKACYGFDSCAASCGDSPTACIYACEATSKNCGTCAISRIISCAGMSCATSLLGAQKCLTTCMIGSLMLQSNADACLSAECGEKWAAAKACLDPKLQAGECDGKLGECGVSFATDK